MSTDGDGRLVRLAAAYALDGQGYHYDIITIVVMSNEWEGPEEGGLIPIFELPPAKKEFMTKAEFRELFSEEAAEQRENNR